MKNDEIKDLILTENTTIEGNLICKNIYGKDNKIYDITVKGNISAGDISAWNISAWNISARDISARDISAGNISAGDISAWNISATGNISAGDISARDISAGDIKYYAFCVVYQNIKGKSIKGRRGNSFHKVLDGKITIKGDER